MTGPGTRSPDTVAELLALAQGAPWRPGTGGTGPVTARSADHVRRSDGAPTDREIAARIRPLLSACALGLVPFTVYSTFLVGIAGESGRDPELMGWLRGTGGVAALVVGLCCAPWLDRVPRAVAATAALTVLAAACVLAVPGTLWTWGAFCLLVGAATAVLNPALAAMAADRFRDGATSGRAATQVSATMTLTAVVAAPLLAGPAVLWGWRGNLIVTALLAILTGIALWRGAVRTAPAHERVDPPGSGYPAALRVVRSLPGVPAVLLVSTLRTTAFMGQLAYLAVVYAERFAVGPGSFSLVWSLSGAAFFLGNWFGGGALRSLGSVSRAAWTAAGAAAVGAASVVAVFLTGHLAVALAATTLLSASHAVVAAAVTTLLVRVSSGHRAMVLGLNGAGQSAGVCLGASVAGVGLAVAGWAGAGVGLAVVTLLAAIAAVRAAVVLRAWDEPSGSGTGTA